MVSLSLVLALSICGSSESFEFDALRAADESAEAPPRSEVFEPAPRRLTLLEQQPGAVVARSSLAALATGALSLTVLAVRYLPMEVTLAALGAAVSPSSSTIDIVAAVVFVAAPVYAVVLASLTVIAIGAVMLSMVASSGLIASDGEQLRRKAVLPAVIATGCIAVAAIVCGLLMGPWLTPLVLGVVASSAGLVAGAVVPMIAAARTPAGPEAALPLARF